jgi:predicted peptidase
MTQQVHTFASGDTSLRYLLHLPPDYDERSARVWPLILFLHGAGERGSDIELVKRHGIPKVAESQPDFPFIAVSPQCPLGTWWAFELPLLGKLLDHVMAAYAVDTERVYLTGISMGGYGAWGLAIAHPDRFAAVVPICGGGDPDTVCAIRHVPVWAFHGALDNVVLPRESRKMVEALRECGGNIKFTLFPNADHDSWTRTYNSPKLYEWLLSQRRDAQSR